MGLTNRLDDGTGRALSLGLDLDYLHVESAECQARLSPGAASGRREAQRILGEQAVKLGADGKKLSGGGGRRGSDSDSGNSSYSGSSTASSTSLISDGSSSNCSTWSEESAVSDSEDELAHNGPGPEFPKLRTPDLDRRPRTTETPEQYRDTGHTQTRKQFPDPGQTCIPPPGDLPQRSKVDFALKLGYSEDLVLLVLGKLGPQALINDILGELVKLGTQVDSVPASSGDSAGSPFPSPSLYACTSSLDSFRTSRSFKQLQDKENLRPVVLDGSNVAMSHGNKEVFSCQGIQLAVDWFLERGHSDITVFVPAWRKEQSRPDAPITDQDILRRLEKEKILVFTPSRRVQGRRVVCYDDRFIVKLAFESDGVIVSNDNYRDLANEKPEWKRFIDERLLMYSFVNDKFMPPDDPLGRHGPSLDNFLRKRPVMPDHRQQQCPYGKKCTYGHKCKFYHPERGSLPQRALADELRASAKTSASRTPPGDGAPGAAPGPPSSQREAAAAAHTATAPPRETPKKRSDPGSFSLSDLLDEQPGGWTRVAGRRGSSSSGCSGSSLLGLPSPGGQDRWDPPGRGDHGSSRAAGPGHLRTYPVLGSPEPAYRSLVRAYSGLSVAVPETPERFSPADLRAGTVPSDRSVGSDSFSPDPVSEDLTCPHHRHAARHPPQRRCPDLYPHCGGRPPPEESPVRAYPLDNSASPHPSCSQYLFSPPSPRRPPPLHRALAGPLGLFPGEYAPPTAPWTSSPHPQTAAPTRNAPGSPWQVTRQLPDPGRFEGPSVPSQGGGGYPGMNRPPHPPQLHPQPHHQPHPHPQHSWRPHYHPQPPHPDHEQTPFPSCPGPREGVWASPWGSCAHPSPPRRLPPAQQSPAAPRPEPPGLGVRHQDLREKVFANLCNIFPQQMVRAVMGRNPHVTDAQQLAADILTETTQRGY